MKKVFSSSNPGIVSHFKNILETYSITCVLKNYYLTGAMGEIPPGECWPELWVLDDHHYAEAKALIDSAQAAPTSNTSWHCAQCGEQIEEQFLQCWKCGNTRPI
jgi:hypothetical protein